MLIVSKFRDYYDTAMGTTGIDKTCVYNRTPFFASSNVEETENAMLFKLPKQDWSGGIYKLEYNSRLQDPTHPLSITPFIIGFCGKTYVGYNHIYSNGRMGSINYITFSVEDFLKVSPIYDKKLFSGKIFHHEKSLSNVQKLYDVFHGKNNPTLFIKNHTPIFVHDFGSDLSKIDLQDRPRAIRSYGMGTYGNNEFTLFNPCLNDYGFFKLFGSAIAFQEIQMYLQGVLGDAGRDMVQIEDKYRMAAHGIDSTSFRQPAPGNKKENRKLNKLRKRQANEK